MKVFEQRILRQYNWTICGPANSISLWSNWKFGRWRPFVNALSAQHTDFAYLLSINKGLIHPCYLLKIHYWRYGYNYIRGCRRRLKLRKLQSDLNFI